MHNVGIGFDHEFVEALLLFKLAAAQGFSVAST
jgi:hypothetical protein